MSGKSFFKANPPGVAYVPLLIVISVVAIAVYTGWIITRDSSAPATPSIALTTQNIECRSVTLGFNITVEDPTTWYQDDTGIASVIVDGNIQTIDSTDKFSHTFPHFVTYSDCSGALTLTLTATDHADNSATYNISMSNVSKPYCCDERDAKEHNCDCKGFEGR